VHEAAAEKESANLHSDLEELIMKKSKKDEALQKVREMFSPDDHKIGILYSGGKDSTALLLTIAQEFPDAELYLFALNNGCHYPEELKSKIVEKIELLTSKGLMSNKVKCIYFDFREIIAHLGFKTFHDDMHKYPTGLLCCTCKLIMHYVTAKYSSRVGISKVADGYSYFERFLPEQLPEFKPIIFDNIVTKYGVECISPLYNVFDEADVPIKIIEEFGLDPDIFLGEKLGQAVCMLGFIYKIPYEVNESEESKNAFFSQLRNAVSEYTHIKQDLLSGKTKAQQKRHDSYGNEYMEEVLYESLMEKIIANKETFFEN